MDARWLWHIRSEWQPTPQCLESWEYHTLFQLFPFPEVLVCSLTVGKSVLLCEVTESGKAEQGTLKLA